MGGGEGVWVGGREVSIFRSPGPRRFQACQMQIPCLQTIEDPPDDHELADCLRGLLTGGMALWNRDDACRTTPSPPRHVTKSTCRCSLQLKDAV